MQPVAAIAHFTYRFTHAFQVTPTLRLNENAGGADNAQTINASRNSSCFSFIDDHKFCLALTRKLNNRGFPCVKNGIEEWVKRTLERLYLYPRGLIVRG